MKRIIFITPKEFPVPAVKGGAVETLLTNLIEENEVEKMAKFYVMSIFNEKAKQESIKYKYSRVIYIKMNIHYTIDKLIQKLNIMYKNFKNKTKIKKYMYLIIRKILKIANLICNDIYNRKVFKKVKKIDFDYIVIEGGCLDKYKNYIKKYPKEKCIVHIHGTCFPKKEYAECYSNFIAISKYIKKIFIQDNFIKSEQVKILNNCIKEKDFFGKYTDEQKELIKKKYEIKEKNVIIFCGRLIKEKGVKELIQAFRNIKNLDDTRLLIIGNSQFGNNAKTEYECEIKQESKDISDKVSFLGYIHNKKLSELYGISDVAVFPSIWEEPSGIVILEAMSSGLPIITTNSGGIPELVNNKCAILLNKENELVSNLTEQIEFILANPEKRKEMGKQAIKIAKNYNERQYYKNFIKIIKEIDGSIE